MTVDEISNADRIKALENLFWIGYPKAAEIRNELEALLQHPKMHRMPNMAVIGETNNGKTMLLNNFYKKHAVPIDPINRKTILPIVKVQMPPEPDENRFYDVILERLFANESPREPVTSKISRLKKLFDRLETRQLILDEFQHCLAGSTSRQRKFLNALKYLGSETQITIVASGTLETLNALQADVQIANRFNTMFLPKWILNDDLLRLLKTMEPKLGLKEESGLSDERLASLILAESQGTIGEIHALLKALAKYAILSGEEKISEKMFVTSTLRLAKWRNPADRKKAE
ncbi:hypothetical protein AAKU64_000028 [Undibacterium sp. GrIS 1.8]|uniref:TniB family NTP-binding protein n=1 Tax=unclassified Undibacterium TaxID=2630295 RepID=UPI003390D275